MRIRIVAIAIASVLALLAISGCAPQSKGLEARFDGVDLSADGAVSALAKAGWEPSDEAILDSEVEPGESSSVMMSDKDSSDSILVCVSNYTQESKPFDELPISSLSYTRDTRDGVKQSSMEMFGLRASDTWEDAQKKLGEPASGKEKPLTRAAGYNSSWNGEGFYLSVNFFSDNAGIATASIRFVEPHKQIEDPDESSQSSNGVTLTPVESEDLPDGYVIEEDEMLIDGEEG